MGSVRLRYGPVAALCPRPSLLCHPNLEGQQPCSLSSLNPAVFAVLMLWIGHIILRG